MSVIVQLVLGGVSVETNRTVEICRICRICILAGECWNRVESWRYWNNVEFEELPGEAGRSWMTGMSGMPGTTGVSGKAGKTGMSGMSGMSLE